MESKLNEFEILNKLGEGSFGQVYKVRRKADKQTYVMKQINISKMNARMKNEALNEASILAKLDSSYIVKYYESFIDKQLLCIVMEFCEGGDLHKLLKMQMGRPLPENQVWRFLIQITLGLAFLHKNKVLHRDIKSMNIFLSKDQVRIGDLGVAKLLNDQNNFARTMVGTPYYLSPEMCEEKPYNEKSDIWALGCVIYELCTFKHPFEANSQGALVLKIIRGRYEPIGQMYSSALGQLIDQCLQKDYRQRPDAFQLLQQASLIQQAQNLRMQLNLNQPHPNSKQTSQIQPIQTPVISKPKEIQQSLATPVAVSVKSTPQGKPLKAKVSTSSQNLQLEVKGKQEPVRDTPIVQKKIVQVPPTSAPNQVQNQNQKMDDFYKDWRDKVSELQKQKQDDRIIVSRPELLKAEFQPNQIPIISSQSNNNQSNQQQNIFSSQQVQPTKKPVLQVKAKVSNPNIEEIDKKRIRKGAPKEPARQVKEPLRKADKIEQIKETPKQNKTKSIKQQTCSQEEVDMVLNLPDFVAKEDSNIKVIKPEREIIDISSFADEIPTTIVESQSDMESNHYVQVQFRSEPKTAAQQDSQNNGEYQQDSDKGAYTDPEDGDGENDEEGRDDTADYGDEQPIQNRDIHTIQEEAFEETNQCHQFIELCIDNKKMDLNKQLLEAEQRKMELEQFLLIKRKECIQDLGQKLFEEVINFLRTKLNSQEELNDKDQEEIDDLIQNKLLNTKNPQIIYVIYKILHFEIEITKSVDKIKDLSEQLINL
ncbi:unnamed protein product (macronuclear) [Paramecium tetraurelia]|uniref:non-specific serine/threonine protein kinase n=1 Tax=Paramecium tetraurelia TaxID=5888 RepID=A0CGW2_PARTE|nr:uncharacterized protein GSPATT00007469001 [Paramecium tetraurelia]CAK70029.1 unnamed protein product [Paramecium tetraurelia]|eukprot:XP_001437426.1 hypothetical protein (macronuclear) [Paramecium tetraurelia strain d4-2]